MIHHGKINADYNVALEKYRRKKYNDAISFCKKILAKKENPEIHHVLGMSCYKIGNFNEAIEYLNYAIKNDPKNISYYLDLGEIHKQNKEYRKSLENFVKVLEINPGSEKAYIGSASVFRLMRIYPSALKMGLAALSVNKQNIEYKLFCAKCLEEMHEFNEAIKYYDDILLSNPNNIRAMLGKAEVLRITFKYDKAIELAKLALSIDKNNIECYLMISVILKDKKKIHEAIEYLDMGLKINPESHQAIFNKGAMLLGLGEFARGWELYESRWKLKELSEKVKFTQKPWWTGEANSTLLIWPEQGIGDEVMFSSMFNEVKKDVNKLIIKTDVRLLEIFKRSFPGIIFIPSTEVLDENEYTHHISMGSIAKFYRKNREDFLKNNNAYLKTDEEKDRKISKYFNKKKDKKYIGVSWRSVNPLSGLKRSATLEDVIKYIGQKNVIYVNLQYGNVDAEVEHVEKKMEIEMLNISEIDNKNDLDGLFSLIKNCDRIVSIDNSTIHFAGAIGVETEVLLHESADFRWEINSSETNWYKSVKLTRNIIL